MDELDTILTFFPYFLLATEGFKKIAKLFEMLGIVLLSIKSVNENNL